MSVELWLGVIALAIPLAALAFDVSARNRANKRERSQRELEATRYKHDQELQATARLTNWASRVVQVMSRADHLMQSEKFEPRPNIGSEMRLDCAAEISALIDKGRWLFRNHSVEAFGTHKHSLNKGFRDSRLDSLVRIYEELIANAPISQSEHRKDFTLKVQKLALPLSEQVEREQRSSK